MWIWIGVLVVLIGTIIALFPNMKPPKLALKEPEKDLTTTEAVRRGAVGVGGD
jgi:hypothetical protein